MDQLVKMLLSKAKAIALQLRGNTALTNERNDKGYCHRISDQFKNTITKVYCGVRRRIERLTKVFNKYGYVE
jgi:hypothetical protein